MRQIVAAEPRTLSTSPVIGRTGALLLLTLIGAIGCGGDGATDPTPDPSPEPTVPDPGAVEIAVSTTGDRFDEDGYFVKLTGQGTRRLEINDETTFEDLPPGDYVVTFGDASLNCPVSPRGDRTVTVEAGATTRQEFEVRCGPLAYVANSSSVTVIAAATHQTVANIDVGPLPMDLVVSPDSATLYVVAPFDGTLKFLDVRSARVERSVSVGLRPERAAIDPSGDFVYVSDSYEDVVRIVSTEQAAAVATISVGEQPRGLAVSPDGRQVYVTNERGGSVSVIDTDTRSVVETVDVADRPWGLAFSPSGRWVYVTHDSGYLHVIDTEDYSVVGEVLLFGHSRSVALSRDGSLIYATAFSAVTGSPQEVVVIDAGSLEVVERIDATSTPFAAAVGPDGDRLYVTNFDIASVTAIETATNEVVATVGVGESPVAIVFVTY